MNTTATANDKIRTGNYAVRFPLYILGLFIMTLGVSMSVKSNLGVSPVSSIPYSITCITGLEMGKATILFHAFLVFLQILILGKAFEKKNFLQVVVGVLFVAAGVGMVYNEFNKKKCRHLDEVNKHKIP